MKSELCLRFNARLPLEIFVGFLNHSRAFDVRFADEFGIDRRAVNMHAMTSSESEG